MSARHYAICVLAATLASSSVSTWAGLFGPSTYDECITDSMQGVQSNAAARLIERSCRNRFPPPPKSIPESRNLVDREHALLQATASSSSGGYFYVDMHNGNHDVTVSRVAVAIVTKHKGQDLRKMYDVEVDIKPLTHERFSFSYLPGDGGSIVSWSVAGATGYSAP